MCIVNSTLARLNVAKWAYICNREFLAAARHAANNQYFAYDFMPFFDWFEEWIDETGLWSGNLTYDHDESLTLIAKTSELGNLEHEWNELIIEYERSANERHPSLTTAERNR